MTRKTIEEVNSRINEVIEKEQKSYARVLIAIPSQHTVSTDFCMSLVGMCNENMKVGIDSALTHYKGGDPAQARNAMVLQAQEFGATHILFVNPNLMFPSVSCEYLLQTGKEVVGVSLPSISFPFDQSSKDDDGQSINISPTSDGLIEVSDLSSGLFLVKMDVFNDLEFPYFYGSYGKTDGKDDPYKHKNDTCNFFSKCLEGKFQPYVDQDLSKQCSIIGQFAFDYTANSMFTGFPEARDLHEKESEDHYAKLIKEREVETEGAKHVE